MNVLDAIIEPRVVFEFWRDRRNGEVWAIELRAGTVVGCCGPLRHKEIDARYLHAFDYRSDGTGALAAQRHWFDVIDPALLDIG